MIEGTADIVFFSFLFCSQLHLPISLQQRLAVLPPCSRFYTNFIQYSGTLGSLGSLSLSKKRVVVKPMLGWPVLYITGHEEPQVNRVCYFH